MNAVEAMSLPVRECGVGPTSAENASPWLPPSASAVRSLHAEVVRRKASSSNNMDKEWGDDPALADGACAHAGEGASTTGETDGSRVSRRSAFLRLLRGRTGSTPPEPGNATSAPPARTSADLFRFRRSRGEGRSTASREKTPPKIGGDATATSSAGAGGGAEGGRLTTSREKNLPKIGADATSSAAAGGAAEGVREGGGRGGGGGGAGGEEGAAGAGGAGERALPLATTPGSNEAAPPPGSKVASKAPRKSGTAVPTLPSDAGKGSSSTDGLPAAADGHVDGGDGDDVSSFAGFHVAAGTSSSRGKAPTLKEELALEGVSPRSPALPSPSAFPASSASPTSSAIPAAPSPSSASAHSPAPRPRIARSASVNAQTRRYPPPMSGYSGHILPRRRNHTASTTDTNRNVNVNIDGDDEDDDEDGVVMARPVLRRGANRGGSADLAPSAERQLVAAAADMLRGLGGGAQQTGGVGGAGNLHRAASPRGIPPAGKFSPRESRDGLQRGSLQRGGVRSGSSSNSSSANSSYRERPHAKNGGGGPEGASAIRRLSIEVQEKLKHLQVSFDDPAPEADSDVASPYDEGAYNETAYNEGAYGGGEGLDPAAGTKASAINAGPMGNAPLPSPSPASSASQERSPQSPSPFSPHAPHPPLSSSPLGAPASSPFRRRRARFPSPSASPHAGMPSPSASPHGRMPSPSASLHAPPASPRTFAPPASPNTLPRSSSPHAPPSASPRAPVSPMPPSPCSPPPQPNPLPSPAPSPPPPSPPAPSPTRPHMSPSKPPRSPTRSPALSPSSSRRSPCASPIPRSQSSFQNAFPSPKPSHGRRQSLDFSQYSPSLPHQGFASHTDGIGMGTGMGAGMGAGMGGMGAGTGAAMGMGSGVGTGMAAGVGTGMFQGLGQGHQRSASDSTPESDSTDLYPPAHNLIPPYLPNSTIPFAATTTPENNPRENAPFHAPYLPSSPSHPLIAPPGQSVAGMGMGMEQTEGVFERSQSADFEGRVAVNVTGERVRAGSGRRVTRRNSVDVGTLGGRSSLGSAAEMGMRMGGMQEMGGQEMGGQERGSKSPIKSCLSPANGVGGTKLKKQVSFNRVVRVRRFPSCDASIGQ
ncbi:unnamed protein product [Closterium sp. Naga37s-1]|nr:unnamed protein product [Closterium sp. Naga37s-1]